MNFLVDAQLPRRMTAWLTAAGCDAIHTLERIGFRLRIVPALPVKQTG